MNRSGAARKILGLLREELPALSAGTVLLVAGAGLSLLYPQGIRAIVDGAISGRDPAAVTRIAFLLAGLAVVQGAAISGRALLFSLAGERGVRRVRERLYASLLSQEVGFFDASRTGELVSRLGTDCATLQSLLSAQISMTLRHAITALGGLALLFVTSPRLTVVMLLVVPPVAVGAVAYGRRVRALARRYQDALADASHVAEESFSALRTVRAFVAEDAERARYGRAVDDAYGAARKRAFAGATFMGAAAAGGYAAMAAVLGYGGRLVSRGEMTPGALTAFLVYTLLIAVSLGALAEIWAEAMRGLGAADRVFQLMERVPEMPLRGGVIPGRPSTSGRSAPLRSGRTEEPPARSEPVPRSGRTEEPPARPEPVARRTEGVEPSAGPEPVARRTEGVELSVGPESVARRTEGVEPSAGPEPVVRRTEGVELSARPEPVEERTEPAELSVRPEPVEGRAGGLITFEHVRFSYPTRPDSPVLAGIDLHIASGEIVALVGASGAGKSTVAALVCRFYDPQAGRILLDGRDLRELDPAWLRGQIGVVPQESILFSATVEENVRYGRPGATQAEVVEACRAAHADAFVRAFPDGYATKVGERGQQLSGGQRQRIAIARAVLKDPRILLLDEATSALDAESEALVQDALERLMRGRTAIVIAHRLSTVARADRVVVLEEGRVVESGAHAALMEQGGTYRRLVEKQLVRA